MVRGSSIAKLRLASRFVQMLGRTGTPRAPVATRGNAAKSSSGIDIIVRASVCSNAFAKLLVSSGRLTSAPADLSQNRYNRGN
jgi:hypothetical protein